MFLLKAHTFTSTKNMINRYLMHNGFNTLCPVSIMPLITAPSLTASGIMYLQQPFLGGGVGRGWYESVTAIPCHPKVNHDNLGA